ncbi:MAG: hypothetical protein IJC64_00530 [Clostridia bacterium]|nr:hypothetical protein [Clostridia bacterium]
MKIEEKIAYIQRKFPAFDRQVIYDTDNRGNDFCEMIMPNQKQPNVPLTVSVSERGCSISVGQIENVTGSDAMTPEQASAAISDILADKIIFVLAYRDGDDTGFGAPFYSRIFALTGKGDDMQEDYRKFIEKINKPLTKISRLFTVLKGRFIIFNFSGSLKREITR